jgi:hypothetical protein
MKSLNTKASGGLLFLLLVMAALPVQSQSLALRRRRENLAYPSAAGLPRLTLPSPRHVQT